MKKQMLFLMLFLLALASGNALAQTISKFEYWVDGDYAHKLSSNVASTGNPATIIQSLDLPVLNNGIHRLSIRFSDNNGKWSAAYDQMFFKADAGTLAKTSIDFVEYWFDGNSLSKVGKSLSAFNGTLTESFDVSALSNGMHFLTIRFRDNNNLWTAAHNYHFFKAGATADTSFFVTKMRYWFDNDSTRIKEIQLPTATQLVDVQQLIDLPGLVPDVFPQSLSIQFADNSGLWSAIYVKSFLPEPSFEAYRYLNTYAFRNTSSFSRSFRWNFGDGSVDSTVNPSHTYAKPGVYTVTLTATNSLGTQEFFDVLQIRGLREVVTNKAGNSGDVSILVYGGGFSKDATVWLEGPAKITADTSYIERMDAVYARFDLRNKAVGVYDVVVQFPGDTIMRLAQSFTIESGTPAAPFVNIEGRNKILFGRWQSYQMTIGNSGNVDAGGVPLFLVISKADGLELDFRNLSIAVSPYTTNAGLNYLLDSIPNRFEIDELFGEAFSGYVYVFYLPSIPANSSRTMELRIKTNQSFRLYSWMNPPYFQSPFDDAVASCINDALAWYALEKGLDLGLKFIPGAGCLKNIGKESYGIMSRVIERKIGKDSDGKPYKSWGEWAWAWGNWAVDMTAIGVGCAMDVFPPTKAAKFAYASYKTIIELNKIKKDIRKLASVDEKCREKFKHLSSKDQSIAAVSSFDPNEMVGPSGHGTERYTQRDGSYDYTIFFENKASATAAAQEVVIIDTLDMSRFDLASFCFGSFSYSGNVNHPLSQQTHFTVDIDSVRNKAELLRINAHIDTSTGIVTWQFITLDPQSMDYPQDPDAGFLPPNINGMEGTGSVSFSVKLKSTLLEDEAIVNRATITFDLNPPIYTNTWSNRLDVQAPRSRLVEVSSTTIPYYYRFTVDASDALSGVRMTTIYASRNDSAFAPLCMSGHNSFYFQCDSGVKYSFFAIATDSVGNEEEMKTQAEQSSETVEVKEEPSAVLRDITAVFPNPAATELSIQFIALNSGLLEFDLIDPLGNRCSTQQKCYCEKGLNTLSINIENLPQGLYFIVMHDDNFQQSRKFLIMR